MKLRLGIVHELHLRRAKSGMDRAAKLGAAGKTEQAYKVGARANRSLTKAYQTKPMTSKPQHQVSVTTTIKAHTPDSNPYGFHAAQLNDTRRALASSVPYNPRKKKRYP